MGMYDHLVCEYPLPYGDGISRTFQTKDTPAQYLDVYTIKEDGTFWHEDYDIEDCSAPNADGLAKFYGCMTRVNKRLERCPMSGSVNFYTFKDEKNDKGWLEYQAYFKAGQLQSLIVIEDTDPL